MQPIVRKNVEWPLSILDESCWDAWRIDHEIDSICHNAVIIQLLCKAETQREHGDVTYATEQLAEMRASSVAAGPAALLGPSCHGLEVMSVCLDGSSLRCGDIILSCNDVDLCNFSHPIRMLVLRGNAGQTKNLIVSRGGAQ